MDKVREALDAKEVREAIGRFRGVRHFFDLGDMSAESDGNILADAIEEAMASLTQPQPETDGDAQALAQAIYDELFCGDNDPDSVKRIADVIQRHGVASHGQGERALREALQTVLPLAAIGLRHLRAKNDPKALQATNDLAYARAALGQSAGEET